MHADDCTSCAPLQRKCYVATGVHLAFVQRHDDVSQKSVSNSGTPKWAEGFADEPMDYSQQPFQDSVPRQDAGRQEHATHRVR